MAKVNIIVPGVCVYLVLAFRYFFWVIVWSNELYTMVSVTDSRGFRLWKRSMRCRKESRLILAQPTTIFLLLLCSLSVKHCTPPVTNWTRVYVDHFSNLQSLSETTLGTEYSRYIEPTDPVFIPSDQLIQKLYKTKSSPRFSVGVKFSYQINKECPMEESQECQRTIVHFQTSPFFFVPVFIFVFVTEFLRGYISLSLENPNPLRYGLFPILDTGWKSTTSWLVLNSISSTWN